MNTWFGSCLLTVVALTFGAAQDFDLDTENLLMQGMAKRRMTEMLGKRDGLSLHGFNREVRRTRELFGKRSAYPPSSIYLEPSVDLPAKRRPMRELLGKRSVEMNPLFADQMEVLSGLLSDRPRRRGGELFGR